MHKSSQQSFDIAVYSATPCGIAAAIAAARHGARVVLIEPSPEVGGHLTNGVNTAETEHMAVWSFGGIAGEFFNAIGRWYGRDHPLFFWENKVAQYCVAQMLSDCDNLEVRTGWHVTHVDKSAGRITRIHVTDDEEVQTGQVDAAVFIDASYEGDVMAMAGVDCTFGRESTQQYGESLAGIRLEPDVWDSSPLDDNSELLPGFAGSVTDFKEGESHHGVICYNFRPVLTRARDNAIPFQRPDDYDPKQYELLRRWFGNPQNGAYHGFRIGQILGLYPRANRKIEANNQQNAIISLGLFGGQFGYPDGDWQTRRKIARLHRSWARGLFWFLATDDAVASRVKAQANALGYAADEFVDHNHFPWLMYVREARRMVGQYVMTQQDVAGGEVDRSKDDSIAIASHFIDSHHIQRLTVGTTGFQNEGRIWQDGKPYQVPYRSLLPRAEQASNLLVPGAASFSHVAFCTYRLESTWMTTGHAAGAAAALACETDKPVEAVDVAALQRLLVDQRQVIHFDKCLPYAEAWRDRQTDPDDMKFAYHWEHD